MSKVMSDKTDECLRFILEQKNINNYELMMLHSPSCYVDSLNLLPEFLKDSHELLTDVQLKNIRNHYFLIDNFNCEVNKIRGVQGAIANEKNILNV